MIRIRIKFKLIRAQPWLLQAPCENVRALMNITQAAYASLFFCHSFSVAAKPAIVAPFYLELAEITLQFLTNRASTASIQASSFCNYMRVTGLQMVRDPAVLRNIVQALGKLSNACILGITELCAVLE